jgi:hypothetical protein
MSAASMAPGALDASGHRSRSIPKRAMARQAAGTPAATVLYDDRAVTLRAIRHDPRQPKDALWVRKGDLPAINEFELKPQGACRADICVPIAKDMVRGDYFDLTTFAKKIGQSVVADVDAQIWSFGEIPSLRGSFLEGRMAPDFVVPDRAGRPVHLSSLRGKKVLVVTWASW